jgi:hypothetical protein
MEVRARLTADAAVRRSEGMEDPIVRYDGVIIDAGPDALSLDVLVARTTSAFQDVEIRDTVRLGTGEIQSLLRRKLSPARTALFSIAVGAAAFAVVKGIDQVVGGSGDDPGDGGTPTFRIPWFTWTGSGPARTFPSRRE